MIPSAYFDWHHSLFRPTNNIEAANSHRSPSLLKQGTHKNYINHISKTVTKKIVLSSKEEKNRNLCFCSYLLE